MNFPRLANGLTLLIKEIFTNLSLSISHSDKYAAVLLAEGKTSLGLDLEDFGKQVERVRHKFLDEAENNLISQSNDELLALHLAWSAKESLYKALNPEEPYLKAFKVQSLVFDRAQQRAKLSLAYQSKIFLVKAYYYTDYVLTYFAE